jgi:hypothetical protein
MDTLLLATAAAGKPPSDCDVSTDRTQLDGGISSLNPTDVQTDKLCKSHPVATQWMITAAGPAQLFAPVCVCPRTGGSLVITLGLNLALRYMEQATNACSVMTFAPAASAL